MPPARPLTNINSSAIPQRGHPFSAQQLTPRTPHSGSRTSRLEQGFSKIPLSESNDGDYDDHGTLQSAPLLASSSTARFSVRSARERESAAAKSFGKRTFVYPTEFVSKALDRLPLAFGIFMGGVLLILIVLSLTRPEALHKYIGAKAPATSSTTVPSTTADSASATASILPEHSVHTQIDAHILSYENYTKFPLTGLEYRQECAKIFNGYMAHGDYWDKSMMAPSDVLHADDKAVCSSTIVYMLDGTAGLTADLALMAQAAALARERNRTFLVDDTHWDRGKWVDHFVDVRLLQPGPEPGCKAPPPQELVACPRTARHWVITARTAKYHFGHAFSNHYENAYGRNLNRLKPIFDTAFESFKNTIVPNAKSKELIQLAREELSKFLKDGSIESPYVGTHIRRGDSKSMSYSYADRKVPLEEYLEAIKATWTRLHTGESSHTLPTVYLATDSPDAQHEFYQAYQGRVFSLYGSKNPTLRAHASPQEYRQSQFDSLDLQARISATHGMVVDLALVSGIWTSQSDLKPDATVCALSSTVCRLAPIGLGWDRAFGHVGSDFGELDERNKHWIEVDQKSSVVPVWRAFLLFN